MRSVSPRSGMVGAFGIALAGLASAGALAALALQPTLARDWPRYAADAASTHYSPQIAITPANVSRLDVAWEWRPNEDARADVGTRPGNFQNTPIMIDDVLCVSTPYNRVVALDAESGAELWAYDPKAYADGQPPNGTGFVHRGVAAWRGADGLRIFINSRYKLIALDARTGEPISSFGTSGVVDLSRGLRWEFDRRHYTNTSPPIVYRDLVIVGNGVGDRLAYKNDPPGDVRAFDARTGSLVWTFHTVPAAGEKGHDTWGDGSAAFTGHTNVWAPMSLDETRGLLYLPVSTPSNDFYGARRPGVNLFAESIVCLDAATGVMKWYYQITHHGLWDYDLPAAPNLVTMNVSGRRIDGVVQLTKQGFAFVFDRVTGEPVWPIEEQLVPPSVVEGERAWATQPMPTRPPAFSPQGVTLDDALDFTPELRAAAQAEMAKYRLGPLYTPPSKEGTLMRPGIIGGANWGGGAFDPESGILYVKSSHQPAIVSLRVPDRSPSNPRAAEVDADLVGDLSTSATFRPPAPTQGPSLPMMKPPYGELTAINLNTGSIVWRVPFGDTPSLRSHPALQGVKLPERLGAAGAPGVIVTRGGLVIGGGGDSALYAFDKQTGKEVFAFPLPRRSTATPMTYLSRSGRQFIVMATGSGRDASLMAFALPK
ncbi:MAG TPA: pyrroloquinoline quinone-dependent dehydrogenase [Vicinamibacterales bacterium]|nr:pyrroloquinoline quinone-dependent dehydrogenase [Vicinamibacterales bacterium]